ncbi:MAG: hypothetical protein HXY40_09780 [Chloroflexi bacterium]|nr:hypothetical protein [Chloroflexota bacterium]
MSEYNPRTSKYRRPRSYFSLPGLLIGLALGIGGALVFAWNFAPVVEFDTEPWQLDRDARARYIVAIMLAYSYDGDLNLAVQRLIDLRLPGDPIQAVADTACQLASTGYVDSSSGLRAIRAMIAFYQSQGRTGCAELLIPADSAAPTTVFEIVVPTSTLPPVATKTPTPEADANFTPTPLRVIVATSAPQSRFSLVRLETFCSVELPGIIEVYVQNSSGDGIPGQAVRVRWVDGESTFYTGLKPERGPAYADFQMQPGLAYTLDMPGQSNASDSALAATPCIVPETGDSSLQSYRAVFRPSG